MQNLKFEHGPHGKHPDLNRGTSSPAGAALCAAGGLCARGEAGLWRGVPPGRAVLGDFSDGVLAVQIRARDLVVGAAGRGRGVRHALERRAQPPRQEAADGHAGRRAGLLLPLERGQGGGRHRGGDPALLSRPHRRDRPLRHGGREGRAGAAAPGDARGDQGRPCALRHGAGQQFPPVGSAGDRGGMGPDLRARRPRGCSPRAAGCAGPSRPLNREPPPRGRSTPPGRAGRAGATASGSTSTADSVSITRVAGSVTTTSVPSRGFEVSWNCPPCSSTSPFTIGRPSPEPCSAVLIASEPRPNEDRTVPSLVLGDARAAVLHRDVLPPRGGPADLQPDLAARAA